MNQSDGPGPVGQSADLRTRIAAVQLAHMGQMGECLCGFQYSTLPELAVHVADAVIRKAITAEFLADLVIQAVQKAADDA